MNIEKRLERLEDLMTPKHGETRVKYIMKCCDGYVPSEAEEQEAIDKFMKQNPDYPEDAVITLTFRPKEREVA